MCTVPQIAPSPSLPSDPTRPLALLAFIGMDAHWTDDPVFDTAWEDVGGGVIVQALLQSLLVCIGGPEVGTGGSKYGP